MKFLTLLVLFVLLVIGFTNTALAVNPDEVLANPKLEARARALSAQLRCLVCQNQSIDDSDAELARDLRLILREKLLAGESDEQILTSLTALYGEFILLKPRFGWHTALLWLSMPLLLLLGVAIVWHSHHKRKDRAQNSPSSPLTTKEQIELDRITKI